MEQHFACKMIKKEKTIYMTEFSFGQKPTSDSCDAIKIPCVYDEIIGEDMPLDRWFEVGGGTSLFSLVKIPVLFEDL
jgi:hypothetical protein